LIDDFFITLSCAQLTNNPTCLALRYLKAVSQVKNRFALACRA
jgi:hypothetical protein